MVYNQFGSITSQLANNYHDCDVVGAGLAYVVERTYKLLQYSFYDTRVADDSEATPPPLPSVTADLFIFQVSRRAHSSATGPPVQSSQYHHRHHYCQQHFASQLHHHSSLLNSSIKQVNCVGALTPWASSAEVCWGYG